MGGMLGRAVGWYGPNDAAGFLMALVGALVLLGLYRLTYDGIHSRSTPACAKAHRLPRCLWRGECAPLAGGSMPAAKRSLKGCSNGMVPHADPCFSTMGSFAYPPNMQCSAYLGDMQKTPKRVELGAFYPVWGQNNYPQWSGTYMDPPALSRGSRVEQHTSGQMQSYIRPLSEDILWSSGPDEICASSPNHDRGLMGPVPTQVEEEAGLTNRVINSITPRIVRKDFSICLSRQSAAPILANDLFEVAPTRVCSP